MKIAQVVCVFPPYKGGIGKVAQDYHHFVVQSGYESLVFTPEYDRDKNSDYFVRIKPWIKYGNGAFIPQLFFYLKDCDIIHFHYPFFGAIEIMWLFSFFKKKKQKIIIHYHMDTLSLKGVAKILSTPSVFFSKKLLDRADFITCASLDYIKNSSIGGFYKKNPQKFIEIPFGVDVSFFNPVENAPLENKLLFVGGLDRAHYFKGLDVLLKSLAGLKNISFNLRVVGNGDLRITYENMARDLGIEHSVSFLGALTESELANCYRSSDIFVLPSINSHEAFGIVLIEAMASGNAVIASRLPGVRNVFEDGKQGYYFSPGNVENLSEKISLALSDKNSLKIMKCEARKHAIEFYDKNKERKKLIAFYENLCN